MVFVSAMMMCMDDNQIQNFPLRQGFEGQAKVNPLVGGQNQVPDDQVFQNPVGTVQNQPAAQPTQAVSQKQDQAASGLGKEQEKIATAAVGEFVKPSETEPVISQEEKEFGVEKVSEYPKLSEEHTKIGVKPSGEGVPVSTVPSGMVQLPMTQVKAKSILKMHKKVSESILWLATLVLKQIKISNKK